MNYLLLLPILVIALSFFSFDIAAFPLISPDEPRYAETAREMIESSDFITPFCNYIPRFDKPILFYWLELLSFKIFGINELAARMPSVLSATGLVWLAYLIGNLHGFPILASVVIASSLSIFLAAKLAITDITLCFFISAALVFFYLGYCKVFYQKHQFALKDRISSHWFINSIIMMAFGFLTKGPVAVVLPCAVIIIFLFLQKDIKEFFINTWSDILIGLVLFLLINLPWYLLIHSATDGAFTKDFFISHNFSRFTATHTGHQGAIWFYLPVIIIGFFPWSFFLIQAITQSLVNRDLSSKLNLQSDRARVAQTINYCLIWALVVFSFFTISKTKLPTYILPLYLPLAIIVANWWSNKFKTTKSNRYRNKDALFGLIAVVLTIVSLDIVVFIFLKSELAKVHPTAFFMPIVIISFLIIAASVIAATAVFDRSIISFSFFSLMLSVSFLVASHLILKPFAEFRDGGSKAFAQSLKEEDQLAVYRSHQTRFSFYAERNVRKMGKKKLFTYAAQENEAGSKYFVYRAHDEEKLLSAFRKQLNADDELDLADYFKVLEKNKVFHFAKFVSHF